MEAENNADESDEELDYENGVVNYDFGNDNESIKEECIKDFSSKDFIMEPKIFNSLKRYFQAGGEPENVIQLLSDNYCATAQMSNILAEWLIFSGVDVKEVQTVVEDHLKDMIIKKFDPRKADKIFTQADGKIPSWLPEMIGHPTWRLLIYKLAEQYSDCLFLNFAIKLISDAGFQNEITSVSTASQQIEIFSKVIKTMISNIIESDETTIFKKIEDFQKLVCHGEHTYLYVLSLLQYLLTKNPYNLLIKRLAQEVQSYASRHNYDSCHINMALDGSTHYPKLFTPLSAMLSKKALNPADISLIYKIYTSNDIPPPDIIRKPLFLELLVEALFKPQSKLNPDHKPKYIHLLAYASCVYEAIDEGENDGSETGVTLNKEELKPLILAIEKAHHICVKSSGSSELVSDLGTLFQLLRYPVISVGVFHWISSVVSDGQYFATRTDNTAPLHLALLDEIATCHTVLHDRILNLLIKLFEAPYPDLEVLVQLELKKTLLERMVHLLSRGHVIPVITFVKKCWEKQDTDVSLIRHFVQEILDMIAPPYHPAFVELFLPLISNQEITGSLRNDEQTDSVSTFIEYCKKQQDQ